MSDLALVTGASGFLGGHLVERLVAEGTPVRVLARETSDLSAISHLEIEVTRGDLRDVVSLDASVHGVDVVFHAAALSADWGRQEDFVAANVDGLRFILEASERAGVRRFVHVSTTDVYGYPDAAVDEDAPFRPLGLPYNESKIAGERLVWQAAERQSVQPPRRRRPDLERLSGSPGTWSRFAKTVD